MIYNPLGVRVLSTRPSGVQQSLIFFTAHPICSLEKLEGPRVRAMLLLLLSNFRLALEFRFLAAFTGAKVNDLHVYICVSVSVMGELCPPKRCSSPGERDLIWK